MHDISEKYRGDRYCGMLMHHCILALALQEKGRCGAQKSDRPRKVWQTERHGERKTRGRGCLNKEETRRKRGG